MTENTTYDQLKTQRHLSLEWRGINSTQICFEKSCFSFKKDHVTYTIEIAVIGDEKKISISVDTPTTFEKIYHYLGDIRRYEYLVDGAFYCMKKCETDGIDVTNSITDVELPYFFSEKYKHKIPLELTDKEYKRYFFQLNRRYRCRRPDAPAHRRRSAARAGSPWPSDRRHGTPPRASLPRASPFRSSARRPGTPLCPG